MVKKLVWWLVLVALVAAAIQIWRLRHGVPEDFTDSAAHYKYGSTGSDHPMALLPIPYWLWKALPEMFPPADYIPKESGAWNGKSGYEAFGLVTEANMERPRGHVDGQMLFDRPIGLSRRTVFGIDFVGPNCAFCHLTTIRRSPEESQQIVLGGTGNTLNIEQFYLYMMAVFGDKKRFNADDVMVAVNREAQKKNRELTLFERFVYRYVAIPVVIPYLLEDRRKYLDFLAIGNQNRLANFGPGRVDTWAIYKRLYVDPPQTDKIQGIVDFPAIWNQRARTGMQMHWDGNIAISEERNIISALAVIGRRVNYLDYPSVARTADFMNGLLPPRYEDRIPENARVDKQRIHQGLAQRGKDLFRDHCAACHAADGLRLGRVEPIEDLGTDPERIRDFSPELADGLNALQTSNWKLRHFRPYRGYVNQLLDGVWLRAPYLHNGSVPTLRDLLNKPQADPKADVASASVRPKKFCRGNDVFDWKNVGFVSALLADKADAPCGTFFLYDTSVTGNSNGGHLYGTELSNEEKDALVEFMKTL